MADAMMMFLGEAHGVNWYWAQPGEFENPGVYYWDGVNNVLCVPHLAAAPEAPAQASACPQEGEWIAAGDYRRNVRALDVALNGDGAAERPSLVDVLAQVEQVQRELGKPVLQALADRQRVPEGWRLVPVVPTEEMIQAGDDVEDLYRRGTPETWGKVFRAMLAAAPEAPAQASAVDERKPLTDEQIVNMANPTQHLPEAPEGWVRFGFSRRHLVGFARSIERAHGIGGEGKR